MNFRKEGVAATDGTEGAVHENVNHIKRIPGYLAILVCLAAYIASMSDTLTTAIGRFKTETNTVLRTDRQRYGDLYGMSYLPRFRKNYNALHKVPVAQCSGQKNLNLFLLCDSYLFTYAVADSFYCGVDNFSYINNNGGKKSIGGLDVAHNNILLLEFTERFFSTLASDKDSSNYLLNFLTIDSISNLPSKRSIAKSTNSFISAVKELKSFFFKPALGTNMEFLVWETGLFTPLREFKASLIFNLFKRTDQKVVMGQNFDRLFFVETVDSSFMGSSFREIKDIEIERDIKNLNAVYDHYKKFGFTEVYLSIIPNPVSVFEPTYKGMNYNGLIPRIEKHPNLKMKAISVYNEFKDAPERFYQPSDTHWNTEGLKAWLEKFNGILASYNVK